jgi:hypothetical protein
MYIAIFSLILANMTTTFNGYSSIANSFLKVFKTFKINVFVW